MQKAKILVVAVAVLLVLVGMTSVGVTSLDSNDPVTYDVAEQDIDDDIEQDGGGSGVSTESRFYQCMIICGIPYLIIVTTLAFLGQGLAQVQALVFAGATAAMVACVVACLSAGGGGGGGDSVSECPCNGQV